MANEKRRLIDANVLLEAYWEEQKKPGVYSIAKMILDTPTVDAVEVVRCKDCAVPHNKWTGCPKLSGLVPPPDFYCAYGERREGE